MQHCVVFVDPVSLLVLEIQQSGMGLLGISEPKWIGRPLVQWFTDPGRDDLSRFLSVALRSSEPRRLRVQLRTSEASAQAVDMLVSSLIRSRNQAVLQISLSAVSAHEAAADGSGVGSQQTA